MEEEGVKEEVPEKPKCAPTADKAGWIKKSSGGLLGLWKDRYILLCKTRLLVYDDEEEQKCIETVELENYDKCQDLRALLKRKNRFILIRSSGKKVHDIKFQAQNLEEKESWMKALNEGINRSKNKILDEVKVDESLSLEHVTRGRVKVGHGRRPPTRIHLKEVAKATSDGILRLDLDIVDNGPPGFTSAVSNDDVPPPKETPKPPMPPTKPSVMSEKQSADNNVADQELKKPVSPPLPPAKKFKESTPSKDDLTSKDEDSVSKGEDGEESEAPAGDNKENLVEVGNGAPAKAPVPPPKILSDKLKGISWDEAAPRSQSTEDLKSSKSGSKENLMEVVTMDTVKPPVPPKVLSETLTASVNSTLSTSEVKGSESQELADSNTPANGMEDREVTESNPQRLEPEEGSERADDQEEEQQTIQEQIKMSLDTEAKQESTKVPSKEKTLLPQSLGNSSPLRTRCASLGDLLNESKTAQKALQGPGFQKEAHSCLAKMEEKVAYEREKTEKLLQKVLRGELQQAQEGNGPPINAEAILNEAVEQLRQATQVLQEIKGLGELNKEQTEKQDEKQKDLVTLYRRSAP
ncbi:pleckstrin homology domain-containing family O member 2 isoform X2 [Emydura macquarii macquarii]|uniref:pleckstrin homology domain-containing family O member 2 isoform X2 n=1 Tax=Emydura macquarii macquarii TaxID=1129001 RepID=UPI003529E227